MRSIIIAAVVALALARPHPRPARDDVARSMAREKRAEITDALKGATGSLHSIYRKAPHSKPLGRKIDPEAAEKERELEERNTNAVENTKRQSEALQKQLEEKRLAKEKLANDMKQMHKALTDATTTTTAAPVDTHILDVPDVPEPKAVPTTPSPAQLAKLAEETNEKQEHIREAEQAAKKQHEAEKKAQAEAKKIKEQESRLHSEAQQLKTESHEADKSLSSVEKDEVAASKFIKEVGQVAKPAVAIAKPMELAPPEKKIEVPEEVQKADEEAKRLLKTKTHTLSKAAMRRTQEEIENEARSSAASLHADAMAAESKQVDADLKQQMKSLKEVRASQTISGAMKDELEQEKQAKKDILKFLKPEHPHPVFRPKKFNPKAPEEVAKQQVLEDSRREGALQDKMTDMMGSMEKIRAQIGH